ncbi:MAG: sigma-54-dependent Fis family transcriptional regulator [Deltaproteobacteria bacterium]|nr:MAG: sigma-54-dependent Fis family transcriptional regulator [Deltaproteobacteria bacterium]
MLIGHSPKMKEVEGLITRVASSHSSVLLCGESGTGKELAAKSIHDQSPRHDKPFIVINCAAIPENLLESELFGHEKGSFTGAYTTRRGLFEEAHTGTLFLDEIGDISLVVQAKLLRVLQNSEIRRVGGSENIKVDVRIISATHRDLSSQIQKKLFREDLFYRLNVITILMPPLRERKEDISLLAYYFMKKFSERMKKNIREIDSEVLNVLKNYEWPGNVRELENAIERALVLSRSDSLKLEDLPPWLLENLSSNMNEMETSGEFSELSCLPYHEAKQKALNLFNRNYISKLLQQTAGNVSNAAQLAGMDRSNFKKIIRKCDVDRKLFRNTA